MYWFAAWILCKGMECKIYCGIHRIIIWIFPYTIKLSGIYRALTSKTAFKFYFFTTKTCWVTILLILWILKTTLSNKLHKVLKYFFKKRAYFQLWKFVHIALSKFFVGYLTEKNMRKSYFLYSIFINFKNFQRQYHDNHFYMRFH